MRVSKTNNKIKLLIRQAYGFRDAETMIHIVILYCSYLKIPLPNQGTRRGSFFSDDIGLCRDLPLHAYARRTEFICNSSCISAIVNKGMGKRAVDGFVPRRQLPEVSVEGLERSPSGNGVRRHVATSGANHTGLPKPLSSPAPSRAAQRASTAGRSDRADIDASLQEIGNLSDLDVSPTPSGRRRRDKKSHKPISRRRKIIKRGIIAFILIIVLTAGWFAYRALMASKSVFKGDLFGLVQQKPLKQDANGRSNILILGTSEDDEGHEAGYLTDSMMVLSIDQNKKNAYMVSVPRDLYVKYGRACDAGYAGKINVYFNCVNNDWKSDSAEDERQKETRSFVGEILGMDLQYSVHVNYSVMRDLVSAIGGIKVNIESRDPRGVMDSNFDWKCGTTRAERQERCPRGHYISYPNGEVELDAEHALYLAMARGDIAPTYGFEQSNFDREKNQQKIMMAIREKALSTGTLTDFSKVTKLVEAIGANLRTNFETGEVRTLVSLMQSIKQDEIKSVSLVDANPAILTTGTVGGASAVVPVAGTYNYSGLQAYIKKHIYATAITREEPRVVVLNGSGIAGAAQAEATKLEALDISVNTVGNAPSGQTYSSNKIYRVGEKVKSATEEKLKSLYHTNISPGNELSGVVYNANTDYVIIITKAQSSKTSN
ncbi:MAG: hypothetical protein D8G53_06690 [Candidatus Saccharimonas sp.]|nr:MAG: hypothetical protein D8G53_06690 [Candidatus Saccharimonas sp.]